MSTPDHWTDAPCAELSLDLDDASQKTAGLQRLGLLGHLFKLAMASEVSAVVDHTAVPFSEGTRAAAQAGHVPGGSRRNLQWVLPHTDAGAVGEDDLLLLADAQTSGGLLVAGELPRAPVIGGAGLALRQRAHHPVALQAQRPSRTALPFRTLDQAQQRLTTDRYGPCRSPHTHALSGL